MPRFDKHSPQLQSVGHIGDLSLQARNMSARITTSSQAPRRALAFAAKSRTAKRSPTLARSRITVTVAPLSRMVSRYSHLLPPLRSFSDSGLFSANTLRDPSSVQAPQHEWRAKHLGSLADIMGLPRSTRLAPTRLGQTPPPTGAVPAGGVLLSSRVAASHLGCRVVSV